MPAQTFISMKAATEGAAICFIIFKISFPKCKCNFTAHRKLCMNVCCDSECLWPMPPIESQLHPESFNTFPVVVSSQACWVCFLFAKLALLFGDLCCGVHLLSIQTVILSSLQPGFASHVGRFNSSTLLLWTLSKASTSGGQPLPASRLALSCFPPTSHLYFSLFTIIFCCFFNHCHIVL